ncbi:hypothetical protein ACWKWC_02655 [Geodermatophilus nigrescens]
MTHGLSIRDSTDDRATVRIEVGRTTCWLYGADLVRLLRQLGVPGQPAPDGALACPLDRVGDVLAALEWRHRRPVELTAVDR